MEESLIGYFDLLGFSDVVLGLDQSRQADILNLLTALSEAIRDFNYQTEDRTETETTHVFDPAISSFSDHIVFSFPMASVSKIGIQHFITYLSDEAAKIFSGAIKAGCLMRGAITIGPLHHKGGPIFGSGLVDAHILESRFAQNARVIVSETVRKGVGSHSRILIDDDGYGSLDFIRAAMDLLPAPPQCTLEIGIEKRRKWIAATKEKIDSNIAALEKAENRAGLQKWRWFKNRFEQFTRTLGPEFLYRLRGQD